MFKNTLNLPIISMAATVWRFLNKVRNQWPETEIAKLNGIAQERLFGRFTIIYFTSSTFFVRFDDFFWIGRVTWDY